MSGLFAMDGYGPYVWSCYALFVLMLLWDLAMPWWRNRRVVREIQARARRDAAKTRSPSDLPTP